MISAAQRADALFRAFQSDARRAAKFVQIDVFGESVRRFADIPPAGDIFADERIQLFEIDVLFRQFHRFHTAADIHAYHGGNDFIAYSHRHADGASFARVYVGHDAYFAVCERLHIADRADLPRRRVFQLVAETNGGVTETLYFDHFYSPLFLFLQKVHKLRKYVDIAV